MPSSTSANLSTLFPFNFFSILGMICPVRLDSPVLENTLAAVELNAMNRLDLCL